MKRAADKVRYVVIYGDWIHGPFADIGVAAKWAKKNIGGYGWRVASMIEPKP